MKATTDMTRSLCCELVHDQGVYDTHYGIGDLLIQANDLGAVLRVPDDLPAYLRYTVRHEL